MNRGARHCDIFLNDADRRSFLDCLAEASERSGIELHSYCLMGNHFHLLVRTPEPRLGEAMRFITSTHARRFNHHHGTDGPLFRGRYRSLLVDSDAYLLVASRYIHLNPVRAGLVTEPEQYRWSSHPAFVGLAATPTWLHTEHLLAATGASDRRSAYRTWVAGEVADTEATYLRAAATGVIGPRGVDRRTCGEQRGQAPLAVKADPVNTAVPDPTGIDIGTKGGA